MSIKRYDLIDHQEEYAPAEMIGSSDGDYVLFTDHLAELHNLLSTLADIRAALGVGGKPMLSELAGIVREVREQADRDERAACKALADRDVAISRAERAEACLCSLDPFFEFASVPSGAEGFVVLGNNPALVEAFAEAASILSSPPADALSPQRGGQEGEE